MTLMNQSQFASHLGRHRSYVTELKQKGLIVMRAGKVDVEASEKLMTELADPAKQAVADRHEENRQHKSEDSADGQIDTKEKGIFGRAIIEQRRKIQLNIDNEKLIEVRRKNKIEAGQLLITDEARAAVADGDAIIRNRLESLPDVLAPQLAAETDEQKIRMLLFDQVEQLLSDLSRSFYQLAK